MHISPGTRADTVLKRADTLPDRESLAYEAVLLKAVAHPGVVAVTGVIGDALPSALELRTVPSRLQDLLPLSAEVAAGLGAALATTLADLHSLGVLHSRVSVDHVLIDDAGRPVLCGFGHAVGAGDTEDAEGLRRKDLADLVDLAISLTSEVDERLAALNAKLSRSRRRPDGRWLAKQFVAAVPAARLPDPRGDHASAVSGPEGAPGYPGGSASPTRPSPTRSSPTGTSPAGPPPFELGTSGPSLSGPGRSRGGAGRGRRSAGRWTARRVAIATAVLAVVGIGVVGTTAMVSGHHRSTHSVAGQCPPDDLGCRPLTIRGDTLDFDGTRFGVAHSPGRSLAVFGRWGCTSSPLPALLDLPGGQIWVFPRWPTRSSPVAARAVTTVSGATGLRVLALASGCDELEVSRATGRPLTISPLRP